VIEERAVEHQQHFDLISIQTSPCSVHDEQGIKNKAHPKVDEEMKVIRMTHYVCIAMNNILFQLKVGQVVDTVKNGHIYLARGKRRKM
jgi:hypothetical protein